ncbi:MAG TPA: gephyrin-like molybdotransferase Glp [Alphaproteobacteria bacterium]|nr:gephyrin-like molybdotransferase Glp [Alphaproteobacteria bacterium]
MAQLSDDCFAHGGTLMSVDAALALLADRVATVAEPEIVPLAEALDRVLAGDLVAARNVPPHDNSAVDGYAVYFDDLDIEKETRLPVIGRAAAGHPFTRVQARGTALRIFTGAAMPNGPTGGAGPDTVMMEEDCRIEGDVVALRPGIKGGANRRRAGEDIAAGSIVLHGGQRLRPQDIGAAASLGLTRLDVRRPLAVALFSTGDELREPGAEAPPGAVYDANRFTLMALLKRLGCRVGDFGILDDDREVIASALDAAASEYDAIITSGGVSRGEEDHIGAVLKRLGSIYFWRLAIKPGRPIALGQIRGKVFVGLPGNPVAMMVTFLRFARPVLLRLLGAREIDPVLYRVRADFEHRKKLGRREWVRARLIADGSGTLTARKFPRDGAGILTSMVESDGLVELPESLTHLNAGSMVDFLPFSEVSR